MKRTALAAACSIAALALCIAAILPPPTARAQQGHTGVPGSVPDLPAGDGLIYGRVVHPGGAARAAGIPVALYALSQSGPGLRGVTTDDQGAFRFESISNDPHVVYLLGANYREVPFGQRVTFGQGQTEIELLVEISDPTQDATGVSLSGSTLRMDWLGANLAIEEIHDLEVAGSDVVFVPPGDRSGAIAPFTTGLPEGSSQLDFSSGAFGEGFERRGDEVLYWGPLYSGPQQIRYRYLVPLGEGTNTVNPRFSPSAKRVTILVPADAPAVAGEGLSTGEEVEIDGRRYRSLVRDLGALPLGEDGRLELAVELPESRNDPSALRITRGEIWLELDDASLDVSADLQLMVEGPNRLAGSPGDPLLHIDIPAGADFSGLSPEAQRLGAAVSADGGLDILGPIAPGEARIGFGYRLPVEHAAETTKLDLRFGAPIAQLNVMIADTGVVVENDRLHRRRPFRSGTRIFLHREAYQVEPGERIELSMTPIQSGDGSRRTSMAATLALAAGSVWFIFAPLGGGRARREGEAEDVPTTFSERAAVYNSIRDLDDDFETRKIDADHYEHMRVELRARAVELLREERDESSARASAPAASSEATPGAMPPSDAQPASTAVRFCPACGTAVTESWSFCADCGESLPRPAEPPAPQSAG